MCSGCRASITSMNGTFSSPAFGLSDYPSNQECLYKIKKPGGGALSLKFEDFDVHQSDFVQVRCENLNFTLYKKNSLDSSICLNLLKSEDLIPSG